MAKFFGVVGYAETTETRPGVWEEVCIERPYYGDFLRNFHKLQGDSKVNPDIDVSMDISILADPFAYEHYAMMRYVVLGGAKWRISSVEVQYPRLRLTIGGLYQ